jgi:putative ABC transport system substrate-binding protein
VRREGQRYAIRSANATRREVVTLLGGAAAAWPFAARAQQSGMPVVGVLIIWDAWVPHLRAAFVQGLAESGYVEGKNLAIETRFANFKPELLPEAARDLVRRNVDAIFAFPEAIVPARNATTSIPFVALKRSRCERVRQESCAPRRQYDRNVS